MGKFLKITGIGCGVLVVLGVGILFLIGSIAPDTAVYTGAQIPKKFMTTIRSLDLLEEGETIQYFYSDGIFDIKSGLYFVTDRKLVVYSDNWDDPKTIIPFDEIESLDANYNDSFFEDSMVYVESASGPMVSFPVSSDQGMDRKFVAFIEKNMTREPPDETVEE